MNTGQWLRVLSTIDNGTALDHYKSIKLQPYTIDLTMNSSCEFIDDEDSMLLYDVNFDKISLSDRNIEIIETEEEIIYIEDEGII